MKVARRAASQHGRISVEQLEECGLNATAIGVRVRRGQLHRAYRGVYAVGHVAWSLHGHFMAAVLAGGQGAVLSHFSAAALWGFWPWEPRDPEVIVVGDKGRTQPALRVHRCRLHSDDVTRHYGIPVTSAARACLDIAAELSAKELRRPVRQAQAENRASVRQIAEVLGRANGHRGAKRLADLIAAGPAPTRSELEDVVLDVLLRGGLPHPQVNAPLTRSGRRIVPDFRWPAQRLVLEADGAVWHDGKLAREDDAERQALLEAGGDRVIRVTWDQAVRHPDQSLARVWAAWPNEGG
ncbi:MAG: type IV toxin-antitoxin system AbiEi family antitoxin domain-containing protein [Solirubrobacteraceae bacterium]